MNDISNLRDTIIPKSDQMNADDLVGTTATITVSGVSRGSIESPLIVNYYNDGGRPFKPCKTMRKLLIAAWGEDGNAWTGHSMTLFCDDTVKYAGKNVGGIRISHLSHIAKRLQVNLQVTRGKKQLYTVNILQAQMYSDELFNSQFEDMKGAIVNGNMTAAQVITQCSQVGTLSEVQISMINGADEQPLKAGFKPAELEVQPTEVSIEKPVVTEQQIQNNF
jgi:hypothetical protein